jgi:hypothetical protein
MNELLSNRALTDLEIERLSAEHPRRTLCWGAIFAGCFAALGLQVLLMMLAAGVGFAVYNPVSLENPVADLSVGAAVLQGLTAVISLFFGGWVAGRFLGRTAVSGTGSLHGFLVWCVATTVAISAVALGAGWAMGDLSKIVGGGLSAAGQPAAAAASKEASELADSAVKQSHGMLDSFTDEGLSNQNDRASGQAIRAKRDLSFALGRFFAADQGDATAGNRQRVIDVLVSEDGRSRSEAQRMVDQWTDSYNQLKADLASAKDAAAEKARIAAEQTAKALAILSLCSFVGFLLGAVFATVGGKHGAEHALMSPPNV